MGKIICNIFKVGIYALLLTYPTLAQAAPLELSLEDSIRLALQNNPTVKVALSEQERTSWGIHSALAGRGLAMTMTHTDSRGRDAPSSSDPNPRVEDNHDNSVSLLYSLYTGGKVDSQVNQAKLSLASADWGVEKARQQVKFDATSAYFSILQTNSVLALDKESVSQLERHVEVARKQNSAGMVALTDVLRSEIELVNAQQSQMKSQKDYDLAIVNLNNIIGLPKSSQITIKDDMGYKKYNPSLDELIQYAVKNRPNAIQALNDVKLARESVIVAQSDNLPSVTLRASANAYDAVLPGDKNFNWSVGLVTSWNILDAGLTKSKVKQAQSSVNTAIDQVHQIQDSIEVDVRSAFLSLSEAEKRIGTTEVAIKKAEQNYKIAQIQYLAGIGTNLDVIDAQTALTQSKVNYVQALYDYNTSKAKIDWAVGYPIVAAVMH